MSKSNISRSTKRVYKLILLSMFLLFNPNFNVLDILPDFIAYFIIYRLLEKAADTAAYFEEARTAFLRLSYVTLTKVPALVLVTLIRSGNTNDTDIFALVTTVYAVLELIFLIPAIKNLSDGLFHLGERTSASALIKPFAILKNKSVSPEGLRNLTYVFAVCKSLFFALPEFLILTTTSDSGITTTKHARFYPYAVVLAGAAVLILGIAWIILSNKYAKAIIKEGEFPDALDFMQTEQGRERYEVRSRVRRMKSALTALAFASFFSIELVFSNFEQINLLPHFLYGLILLYAMKKLFLHSKASKTVYLFGALYIAISATTYVFSFKFLNNFAYRDLLTSNEAVAAYEPVMILSIVETVSLIIFLVSCALSLKSFVKMNTGLISPSTDRYQTHKKEYHKSIIKRFYLMFTIGGISGIAKCINVFLNRDVQVIVTRPNDIITSSYVTSALPWFGTLVFASAVIYIGYSFYFISTLKDEIDLRYSESL